MRPLRLFGVVAVGALAAGGLALAFAGGDIQESPPELNGPPWHARRGDTAYVVYVTREGRERRVRYGPGSSYWRYDPYTRYTLVARRVPDGAPLGTERLADRRHADESTAPRVLGVTRDVIWLWRDSVEARRLPSLGALPAPRLAALPKEPKGFVVAPDSTRLLVRGRDARFYAIDPSGAVAPLDPATLPATTSSRQVEDRLDFLVSPGRAVGITNPAWVMQRYFGTPTGQFYALLSESERATLGRWPGASAQPWGAVARSPYRVPYRLDDRRRPEIDPGALEPLGTERLIQAGFLVRGPRRVWDVADPSSTLVMAKRALGDDEPWDVLRLARDGAVLWRTSTGLPRPFTLLDLGDHVAFTGQEPLPLGDRRRGRSELVVWVDTRTGAARTLRVATGEVQ